MNVEFIEALNALEKERGISKEGAHLGHRGGAHLGL